MNLRNAVGSMSLFYLQFLQSSSKLEILMNMANHDGTREMKESTINSLEIELKRLKEEHAVLNVFDNTKRDNTNELNGKRIQSYYGTESYRGN